MLESRPVILTAVVIWTERGRTWDAPPTSPLGPVVLRPPVDTPVSARRTMEDPAAA